MDFEELVGIGAIGFVILVFLFIAGLFTLPIFFNGIGASQGQHTGVITAVEHNTNIIWDADIVYFKSDAESTQEETYCVNDDLVKQQLEQRAKSRQLSTIKFENDFWFMRWECNGGISIITGVE